MFSSKKQQPKRLGGAPFSTRVHPRRKLGQPLSARTSLDLKARASAELPLSARNPAASDVVPGTPGARAEQYYRQIIGKSGSQAGEARDWILVQEIDALDHLNQEEQKKRAVREKEVKYREQLQEQLQAKGNIVHKCREVWKEWRSELEDDVVQFQKEEELKRVYKLETQKEFAKERQKQLDDDRRRREKRKEEEVEIEHEMMRLAEQAKLRQDEADQKKRTTQKSAMQQMKDQADSAVLRKQHEKQQENARDIKMQKEYTELLIQQEQRRDAYFHALREKQSNLTANYESGVGNRIAKQAAEDEERARRHQAQKEAKAKAEHEAKERWRRDLAESGQAAVKQQLSLQAQERQRKREEDQRYIEKQRQEDEIAIAKEADKVQKKKMSVLANAEYIRKQIQEKEAKSPSKTQMTEIERLLNREKLQRACDPDRPDGLQSLVGKKRAEYRPYQPVSMPC